ncbi:MAG: cytochrome c [Gammaproteobacteria bacterium]|jgi:nitric oxide reductase subunit C
MASSSWWSSEDLWRKVAIWVTAVMFVVLIILTFNSMSHILAGSDRVPPYSVINKRIFYQFNDTRTRMIPVIGDKEPLFGKILSDEEAEKIVTKGKLTIQSKNCINCHTLLGNGAYYAPDLTKAWLDPTWASEDIREQLMVNFLMDPSTNARTYGSGRKMPNLGITKEEAKSIVAFLKWMSAINTNGFPNNFQAIKQGGKS